MSHDRMMSIHGLLMRLLWAFRGWNALNGNIKPFVFDLTCDVTGNLGVIYLIHLIDLVQGYPFPFYFFRHVYWLLTEGRGRYAPPPPPQQRVGVGLGLAGRGLTKLGFRCRVLGWMKSQSLWFGAIRRISWRSHVADFMYMGHIFHKHRYQ